MRRQEREKEREHELKLAELNRTNTTTKLCRTRFLKVLPKSNEDNVPKFFLTFDKVAYQLELAVGHQPNLFQSTLTGKALVAYSCLSAEDSTNSEKEKKTVLNAFELDPEAQMQIFRNL